MRKIVHLCIGIFAFLGYAGVLTEFRPVSPGYLVLGFIAVLGGSALPDVLEAPVDSRHRRFFHSRRMLKCSMVIFAACVLVIVFPGISGLGKEIVFGLSCGVLGYIFHLLADSITPRGLPG